MFVNTCTREQKNQHAQHALCATLVNPRSALTCGGVCLFAAFVMDSWFGFASWEDGGCHGRPSPDVHSVLLELVKNGQQEERTSSYLLARPLMGNEIAKGLPHRTPISKGLALTPGLPVFLLFSL